MKLINNPIVRIGIAGAFIAIALSGTISAGVDLEGSRPNIILVMTDDQPLAIRYYKQLEEKGIPDWEPDGF